MAAGAAVPKSTFVPTTLAPIVEVDDVDDFEPLPLQGIAHVLHQLCVIMTQRMLYL